MSAIDDLIDRYAVPMYGRIVGTPDYVIRQQFSEFADELRAVSAALGSVRFMDPPDGGDVSLAEQVTRMRQALEHAEKWRDQFDCCMCGSRMDDHNIGSGHSPVSMYDYYQGQLEKRAKDVEAVLRDARQFVMAPAEDRLWPLVYRMDAVLRAESAPHD